VTHSAAYRARLASREWAQLRIERIAASFGKCDRCRRYLPNELELHHRSCVRLGQECDDDLELLCGRCDPVADRERLADQRWRLR
jgi:hypothetical protein